MFLSAAQIMLIVQPETKYQANISEYMLNQFMTTDPTSRAPPAIGESLLLYSID
jgi:hypothetical protein